MYDDIIGPSDLKLETFAQVMSIRDLNGRPSNKLCNFSQE
jgi:hypothetical protein